jgi:hypothetical protein
MIDHGSVSAYGRRGLTVREHFAAMAMQGILATQSRNPGALETAKHAVDCADALIAALHIHGARGSGGSATDEQSELYEQPEID